MSSNFRITDFQCALGLSQLKKITKFKIKRQKLVREYIKSIDNETNGEISFYNYDLNRDIAYHLFCVQINFNSIV